MARAPVVKIVMELMSPILRAFWSLRKEVGETGMPLFSRDKRSQRTCITYGIGTVHSENHYRVRINPMPLALRPCGIHPESGHGVLGDHIIWALFKEDTQVRTSPFTKSFALDVRISRRAADPS